MTDDRIDGHRGGEERVRESGTEYNVADLQAVVGAGAATSGRALEFCRFNPHTRKSKVQNGNQTVRGVDKRFAEPR